MQIDTINGIPVLSDVGPSGGRVQYIKLVAVDGSGNVTPLQVNADGSIQAAIESSAADPVYVRTQDLTPDAAQVMTSPASGLLQQPGTVTATIQGTAGNTSALYAVIATNGAGDSLLLLQVSLTTVPNALSVSNYVAVQWSAAPGATGYKLVKSTNGGSSWVQVGATLAMGVLSLADTGQSTTSYTPATVAPPLGTSKGHVRGLAATVSAIKTAPGTLFGLGIYNGSAASAFIQLFDAATGSVTPGTTVPDIEIEVPATSFLHVSLPALGVAFGTAISALSATAAGGGTGSAAGVNVTAYYI